MQFRKGIVAAATAAAVLTSGVSVAVAEETKEGTTQPTTPTPTPQKQNQPNNTTNQKKDEGSSAKDMSPKEIQDWIAVVTAVIGLLGTLFAFGQKFIKP